MPDYIVCTRAIKGGSFSSEPGPTRFLKVPDKKNAAPSHEINRSTFIEEIVGTPTARKCAVSSLSLHCVHRTNYHNPYDSVLKLSNVKRIGVAPHASRVGLSESAPAKAVGVDCGVRFLKTNPTINQPSKSISIPNHNQPLTTVPILLSSPS